MPPPPPRSPLFPYTTLFRSANAATDLLYTEETGVNSIVLSATDDFDAMCANLAFSLALYSGQMCTTPQNIFIPEQGIRVGETHKSYDEEVQGSVGALEIGRAHV